jgi:hypothetical protein
METYFWTFIILWLVSFVLGIVVKTLREGIELDGLFEDNERLEMENRIDLERILRSYKTTDSELAQAARRIRLERNRPS